MNQFLDILMMIGAALFMAFFFGFCIFFHELGHFLAAKWRGLKVTAFSIGFRKIWGRTWNGVEYRIGWIPFGGYVELPQIDADDKNSEKYEPVKPLDRMIVVFAGPLFNFIFGFALAVVIWLCGVPQDTALLKEIEVAKIEEAGPEYRAGLRKGDVITHLNGTAIDTTWNGFIRDILTTIGPVRLTIRRDGQVSDISYVPEVNRKMLPDEEIAYPFFMPKLPITLYPDKNSPAKRAGMQQGDRLVRINGKSVNSFQEFENELDSSNGKPVAMTVLRNGQEINLEPVAPEPLTIEGKKGIWMAGIYYRPDKKEVELLAVVPGSPAESAGLKVGDIITLMNQKPVTSADISAGIQQANGSPIELSVLRDGNVLDLKLTPSFKAFYTIGVQYAYVSHPTPWRQFTDVLSLTWKSMRGIGYSLGNTLGITEQQTTIKAKHMSGPIGIGRILYLSVYRGSLIQGLNLVVLITFNLGLLNLLPIPVLDGGYFMLSLLEIIFRRPVPKSILRPISYAFVAFLICFMIFVSFYDTKRLIHEFVPEKMEQAEQANP